MKTLTFKANETDLNRINELKSFYSECWNINPEEISTSDILRWSIGMLYGNKVEQNFRWITIADIDFGEWNQVVKDYIKAGYPIPWEIEEQKEKDYKFRAEKDIPYN